MQRNYLNITVIVTIIGAAFIFLPATYEIHMEPELVTLWEDSAMAQRSLRETVFSFNTGEHSVDEGISPYVKVWSDEAETLNTTRWRALNN